VQHFVQRPDSQCAGDDKNEAEGYTDDLIQNSQFYFSIPKQRESFQRKGGERCESAKNTG